MDWGALDTESTEQGRARAENAADIDDGTHFERSTDSAHCVGTARTYAPRLPVATARLDSTPTRGAARGPACCLLARARLVVLRLLRRPLNLSHSFISPTPAAFIRGCETRVVVRPGFHYSRVGNEIVREGKPKGT